MDRDSRNILFAFVAVVGLTALALAVSLAVSFDVKRPATLQRFSGDVELDTPGDPPASLDSARDDRVQIKTGQTLRVLPGGTATLRFDLNGGRAIVAGPADLTLVESYRRATTLGHILDKERFERKVVLTLMQSSGTVEYRFASTDPAFEEVGITIQLPESDYIPTTPCWTLSVRADGTAQAESLDCAEISG